MSNYAAGISIGIASTALSAVGLLLQKQTHIMVQKLPIEERESKPFFKRPRFAAGIAFMVLGALLSLAVFALIGQSESAALGALTMVWNALLAARFLGERFTRVDLIAVSSMMCGTVISVAFKGASGSSDESFNVDRINAVMQTNVMYIGSGVIAALFVGSWWLTRKLSARPLNQLTGREQWLLCFSQQFLAGLFSGTTGLTTKACIEIITTAVADGTGADFGRFEWWLLIVALPVSLVQQIGYLNKGLATFPAMMVVPIYQSMIVIAGVMFGFIYWDETRGQSDLTLIMFGLGCVVTVLGIVFLNLKPDVGAGEEQEGKNKQMQEGGETGGGKEKGTGVSATGVDLEMGRMDSAGDETKAAAPATELAGSSALAVAAPGGVPAAILSPPTAEGARMVAAGSTNNLLQAAQTTDGGSMLLRRASTGAVLDARRRQKSTTPDAAEPRARAGTMQPAVLEAESEDCCSGGHRSTAASTASVSCSEVAGGSGGADGRADVHTGGCAAAGCDSGVGAGDEFGARAGAGPITTRERWAARFRQTADRRHHFMIPSIFPTTAGYTFHSEYSRQRRESLHAISMARSQSRDAQGEDESVEGAAGSVG